MHGRLEQASRARSRKRCAGRSKTSAAAGCFRRTRSISASLRVSAVVEGRVEHVRVDRTFIEDGTRWLIDYKISRAKGGDPVRFVQMQVEKYRPDMQRYVRVLRAIRPASGALRALSSAARRVLSG